MTRPFVVCLCGSTRFHKAFQWANYELTMRGVIVLTVGVYPHSIVDHQREITAEKKKVLDELHLRKIDLADAVLVLNVGGYIGESTWGEIEYAHKAGKSVRYLEALEPEEKT